MSVAYGKVVLLANHARKGKMKYETEITNSCTCTKADEDGNEVLDESGEPMPSDYCYGYCWEMAVEDYTESFLKPWLEVKGIMQDSPVRVHGSAMTWLRRSGYADTSARGILDALSINGDYRLSITYENGDLLFTRYSHDEPTGASFTIEPRPIEDDDTEWG